MSAGLASLTIFDLDLDAGVGRGRIAMEIALTTTSAALDKPFKDSPSAMQFFNGR